MPEEPNDKFADFHELTKKHAPWDVRADKIRERFPSVSALDWDAAFGRDLDLFARVLRDILKLEQAKPGRPGPRPSLDVNIATRRMQQFFGRDYTIEPFQDALRVLAGDLSHRKLAAKTGLDRNAVQRLLAGEISPGVYEMEQIAKSYGKAPSYFLEYRLLFIISALHRRLEWSPETSIDLYRTLVAGVKAVRRA